MSGKTGKRLTGNKPASTRRHDSLADGAFGNETVDRTRTETERNVDRAGQKRRGHAANQKSKSK